MNLSEHFIAWKVTSSATTTNFRARLLSILRQDWHDSFDVGAAFVEDFGFEFFGGGFGGFAVGFGHGFGIA